MREKVALDVTALGERESKYRRIAPDLQVADRIQFMSRLEPSSDGSCRSW